MLTLKTEVIQYLEHETKSFDYTVSVLDALQVQISKEIQALGGNMELSTIMDVLHVDDQIIDAEGPILYHFPNSLFPYFFSL